MRKQRVAHQAGIQAPQFDDPQALEHTAIELLEDQMRYQQQIWEDQDFAQQEANDVLLDQIRILHSSFQSCQLPLLQTLDVRFEQCDLANCALDKWYARRTELLGCRLIGTRILDADLADLNMQRCQSSLLRLWSSNARGVRFERCVLQEASFTGSDLSGAVFTHCDLSKADLRDTKLKGTDLRGSTITDIQLNSHEIKGLIVDPTQALYLIQLFGVVVKPEEG